MEIYFNNENLKQIDNDSLNVHVLPCKYTYEG